MHYGHVDVFNVVVQKSSSTNRNATGTSTTINNNRCHEMNLDQDITHIQLDFFNHPSSPASSDRSERKVPVERAILLCEGTLRANICKQRSLHHLLMIASFEVVRNANTPNRNLDTYLPLGYYVVGAVEQGSSFEGTPNP